MITCFVSFRSRSAEPRDANIFLNCEFRCAGNQSFLAILFGNCSHLFFGKSKGLVLKQSWTYVLESDTLNNGSSRGRENAEYDEGFGRECALHDLGT